MAIESDQPDPVKDGLISGPFRTEEGFNAANDILTQGLERGVIRAQISCQEFQTVWFERARQQYVDNNPEADFVKDSEIGLHAGSCEQPKCVLLNRAYFVYLRFTSPDNSKRTERFLEELRKTLDAIQS